MFIPILLLTIFAAIYPFTLLMHDHVEVTVASTSWLLDRGAPLYPSLDDPARYAMPYGPLTFELNYLVMKLFGPSFFSAKFGGVLALLLTFLTTYRALRLTNADADMRVTLLGTLAFVFLIFHQKSFWNRPDSYLLLCTALACLVSLWQPTYKSATFLGSILGITINFKVHGSLYILPFITYHIYHVLRMERMAPLLITLLASMTVFLVIPFIPGTVSLTAYIDELVLTAQHGLHPHALIMNIIVASSIIIPILILTHIMKDRTSGDKKALVSIFSICLLIVTLIGGKAGAGPHHILPFILSAPFVFGLLLPSVKSKFPSSPIRLTHAACLLALIAILAFSVPSLGSSVRYAKWLTSHQQFSEILEEVQQSMTHYRGSSIAVGYSQSHYWHTHVRPYLVFHGHPYLLDAPAIMDVDAAGIAIPESTLNAVRRCEIDIWLIPADGTPFALKNVYTNRPLFHSEFRDIFLATYEKIEQGQWFDSWACKAKNPS